MNRYANSLQVNEEKVYLIPVVVVLSSKYVSLLWSNKFKYLEISSLATDDHIIEPVLISVILLLSSVVIFGQSSVISTVNPVFLFCTASNNTSIKASLAIADLAVTKSKLCPSK